MKLTIGMAACNNYDEVWFTVQSLRACHNIDGVEILIVDNSPEPGRIKSWGEAWLGGSVRVVEWNDTRGTAPAKNKVFQEASGEWVLLIDSHVILPAGVIDRVKEWCENNQSQDLYHGVLLYEHLSSGMASMRDEWGSDNKWGVWGGPPTQDEPFTIDMHGMGLALCRKDAWLGFNEKFRGFSGEEGYIHTKFKQAGRAIWCLPWLKWVHKFRDVRHDSAPYPCLVEDICRNYLIGFEELGLDNNIIFDRYGDEMVQRTMPGTKRTVQKGGALIYKERNNTADDSWKITGDIFALDQKFTQPDVAKVLTGAAWERSLSSKNLAMFLPGLVAAMKAKTILEIGLGAGFTSQILGRSLAANGGGTLVSVDIAAHACDTSFSMTENLPITHKVILGDTKEIDLVGVAGAPIDFVLIDGDHSYEGCKNDLNKVVLLLAERATIVVHDYNEAAYPGVVKAVNELRRGWARIFLPVSPDTVDEGAAILQRGYAIKQPEPVSPRPVYSSRRKVSCLTATHGRYQQLTNAVSCFMSQDYQDKELVILNAHPVPLKTDLPGVRIYNEPWQADLGSCRNRLLQLAEGEYINTWDDDDWWFPWHLSQAMAGMGDYPGWKPSHSWFYFPAPDRPKHMERSSNAFEASIVFRKAEVEAIGYKQGQGDEHTTLYSIPIKIQDVTNEQMSYVYTWGMGMHHASGSLGNQELTLDQRIANWKAAHQDVGDGVIKQVSLDWLMKIREEGLKQCGQ